MSIVKLLRFSGFSSENKTTCGFQICALAKMWKNLFFVLISRFWLKLRLVSFFHPDKWQSKKKAIQSNEKSLGLKRKRKKKERKKKEKERKRKKKKEKGKKKKQKRIKIFDEVMQRKWNETLFSFNGNVLLFFVYFYFLGLKNCLHNGEQIKGTARILRKCFCFFILFIFSNYC